MVREIRLTEVISVRLEKESLDIYACRKEGNDVWDKDQLFLFWRVAEIKGKRSLLACIFSLQSEITSPEVK